MVFTLIPQSQSQVHHETYSCTYCLSFKQRTVIVRHVEGNLMSYITVLQSSGVFLFQVKSSQVKSFKIRALWGTPAALQGPGARSLYLIDITEICWNLTNLILALFCSVLFCSVLFWPELEDVDKQHTTAPHPAPHLLSPSSHLQCWPSTLIHHSAVNPSLGS
jgi:hypothetical protein